MLTDSSNCSLNAQQGYNALADGMLSQIRWHNSGSEHNPFSHLDLIRAFVHWKNGRQMNNYIGTELDRRYQEYQNNRYGSKNKSAIDLILQAYLAGSDRSSRTYLEPAFRAFAISQIRLFVFAGHDSTASVLCYCFHLLSQHPDALARLREEHDDVFGPNPTAAASMLTDQPHLVSRLSYTLAVIKETMRMFPPAGATRAGKSGISVRDDLGHQCPTDRAMLLIIHVETHVSPKYWSHADRFLPDRWLVPPNHDLYPRPGAWRPFEHGPRNCIAQSLVMTELRVILACLVRSFDVEPAYDEWDLKHPSGEILRYRGNRAYQIEEGAAHPAVRYPCRIRLADQRWD
jgi:cytochrome P450